MRDPGRWPRWHRCKLKAVTQSNGKWLCRVHDPVAIRTRDEQAKNKFDCYVSNRLAPYRLNILIHELREIQEIANGEVRAAIEAAIKRAEGE